MQATSVDLRRTARIRALLDFLADALAKEASLLEGVGARGNSPHMTSVS